MFTKRRLSFIRCLASLVFLFSLANTASHLYAKPKSTSGKTVTVPSDFNSIQAAIDATQEGDIVSIRDGNYKETLTLKSDVSLKGRDANNVIIYCDVLDGPVLSAEYCNSLEIANLTLMHNCMSLMPANFKGRFPVLNVNSSTLHISRCKIQNSGFDGILTNNANVTINECIISDNNNYGMAAYKSSILSLSDNIFCRNGANGLFLNGIHSADVCRNTCNDNGHHGIAVAENSAANLTQNNCCNNKYSGIFFGLGSSGSVKNNTCRSNDYQGIAVIGSGTNVAIQNNTFTDNNYCGIYFDNLATGSINNNNCSNNNWHGISIADESATPAIHNNKCFKNKHCGLYLATSFKASASDNEYADNGDISWSEICDLRNADKFEQLETIASRLIKQKSTFLNGNWQLGNFYAALGEGWGDMKYFPQIKSTFDDWMQKYPRSVTPRIALARAYKAIAWKARGGRYANEVTEQGWKDFKDNLKQAEYILIEADDLNASDPELYAIWLTVGMGLSKTSEEMDSLFNKGIAIEKYYWPLYENRAMTLLPRWHGRPGQLETFARHAVELTNDKYGQILYLKVAESSIGLKDVEPRQFKDIYFSYEKLQQACDDYVRLYPDANDFYMTNVRCFLACAYDDKDTALRLFAQIGSAWHKKVWCNEDTFNKYKNWAITKNEKLPEPNE